MTLKIAEISENDQKTWDLFKSGKTVGCFQLEKAYTGEWCRKIKPETIEDLSDILSLIRPGCTKAIEDGKSMTQHYVDRRNGSAPLEYKVPELSPILGDTQGVLIYQEQAMRIAMEIAGYSEQQAEVLRKAIGKKDTKIMSDQESEFLDGIKKMGIVSLQQGKEIFENIRKSQRYSFNKSHGVEYATNTYLTGYMKANWEIEFFCIYLQYAAKGPEPYEEVRTLVNDAKDFGINVRGPYLPDLKSEFYIKGDDIYFGLSNIKGLGDSHFKHIEEVLKGCNIVDLNYTELIVKYLLKLGKTTCRGLVVSGALDYLILKEPGLSRAALIYYIELLQELKEGEITWLETFGDFTKDMVYNLRNLCQPKKSGGGCHTESRQNKVRDIIRSWQNPSRQLQDTPETIAIAEEAALGISITCHITESYDAYEITEFCSDVQDTNKKNFNLGVSLVEVSQYIIPKGPNAGQIMGFITAEDKTGSINSLTAFADVYAAYSDYLVPGNVVGMSCSRGKKGLIINKVWTL